MNKPLLAAFFSFLACSNVNATLWQDTSTAEVRQLRGASSLQQQSNQVFRFNEARLLSLDMMALDGYLNAALPEGSEATTISIQLPLPNGEFVDYLLYESPIMEPGLAAKYPEIRTFKVVATDNSAFTGRLDLTPQGFHAVLHRGAQVVFIDPLGNSNHYQSYYKHDYAAHKVGMPNHQPFVCNHGGSAHLVDGAQATLAARILNFSSPLRAARVSFGAQIKTYRLAIAATGEFTEFHGGTRVTALAALVTGINRINEVYERDLAVKLQIIDNNDAIIYTDPNTDPFDGSQALADLGTPTINQVIGAANYDVGHVISGQGIGGQAGLGVICGNDKGGGETSSDSPINDPFFIDFVAHELGHQFGAQHSFNGTSGSCGGGNRSGSHAYEPGSGTTIMGYAGICGNENVQANSDAYFHSDSIEQIRAHLDEGSGNNCGVASGSNTLPTAEAGENKIIPAQTPFTLTGSGSDADGDTLTYAWEQFNLGPATRSRAGFIDDGQRSIFRSFMPTASPIRTLPQLSDVLSGNTTYGELMPTVSRDLNFRLTVRDGKGGVVSDGMKVQVVGSAGPFRITSPTSSSWSSNNQTIVWDVANTDTTPINCSTVKIDLSTNGGSSFATTLLASTPNDGNATVTLPAINTSQGRVRVSCTNQPFFAVNSANISINSNGISANNAPIALNDSFSFEQSPNARQLNVLENDRDSDNDTLTITNVDSVGNHNIAISNDGRSISFTHSNNFSGIVNFNYTISDGTAQASAGISVNITAAPTSTPTPTPSATPVPANAIPVAKLDNYEVTEGSTTNRFTPLDNDTDADGDTLVITAINSVSGDGEVTITENGKALNYQPATGFTGNEIINYTIRDVRNNTASANISVTVNAAETNDSGGGGSTGWLCLFYLLLLTIVRVMATRFSTSGCTRYQETKL